MNLARELAYTLAYVRQSSAPRMLALSAATGTFGLALSYPKPICSPIILTLTYLHHRKHQIDRAGHIFTTLTFNMPAAADGAKLERVESYQVRPSKHRKCARYIKHSFQL